MNRLGMMVDISHVSDKTFWDVIATTRAPIIASHSSARALTDAPRNMTDEMLRAIDQKQRRRHGQLLPRLHRRALAPRLDRPEARTRKGPCTPSKPSTKPKGKPVPYTASDKIDRELRRKDRPRPPLNSLIDHFDHVIKVAGIDHVGIGTDFDGIPVLPRASTPPPTSPKSPRPSWPEATPPKTCDKILGGNLLRVFRDVQAAAEQIKITRYFSATIRDLVDLRRVRKQRRSPSPSAPSQSRHSNARLCPPHR